MQNKQLLKNEILDLKYKLQFTSSFNVKKRIKQEIENKQKQLENE